MKDIAHVLETIGRGDGSASEELVQSGVDKLRRSIRDRGPQWSFNRLNTIRGEELTAAAGQHLVEAPRLVSPLRGDRRRCVVKALENDRRCRRDGTDVLAMDPRRPLDSESEVTRPPSRLYRFQRTSQRNKGILTVTSAVALAVLLGLALSIWFFYRDREARQSSVEMGGQQAALGAETQGGRTNEADLRRQAEAPAQPAATNEASHEISPATILSEFGDRGIRVHDPSTIVKCKDEYWIFYTGRGVPSYHSKDLTNWERGPRVFTNAPAWVAETVPGNRWMNYWAPDVIHLGDRYLLYYSASTFGRNKSAIGLATTPTLDPNDPKFGWNDQGVVVQSERGDNFNTIDPAVTQDTDGSLWLAFGSYWSGIKLIQLDPKTGKRIAADSPVYSLAHNDSIEASFIYHHGDQYYLFVNWGRCCRGTNSTYEIRVGRSPKITGPYLDRDGKDLVVGGGTAFLATHAPFFGPGHAGILADDGHEWFSCHFYDGTRRGASALAILPLHWSADGWPELHVPHTQ